MKPNAGHWASKGLVGCWLMNEGSGNKVYDLSGNGNHGTNVNTPSWSPGKYGIAPLMSGDEVNHYDTNFDSSPYSELTVISFVRIDSIAYGYEYVADHSDGTAGFGLRRWEDGIEFFCYVGGDHGTVLSNRSFTAGEYVHIAAVHLTSNTLYLDGTYDNSTASSLGIDDSTDTMRIGAQFDGSEEWDGLIEYLFIYNRALSASEIAQLYREPFCMFDRDDIALWSPATQGGVAPTGNAGIMTCNTGFWGATF